MYSRIISTKALAQHIDDPDWVVVDCRFQPADNPRKTFVPHPNPELQVSTEYVDEMLKDAGALVVDARARERYLGEVEPWDSIAGHIPGAISAPFAELLTPEGTMLPIEVIGDYFKDLLGDVPPVYKSS